MTKKNKVNVFEYILQELEERRQELGIESIESFSRIKSQKILFFISAISQKESSTKSLLCFNEFTALPYGPVEMDIFQGMKEDSLRKYNITKEKCSKKEKPLKLLDIDPWIKDLIDKSITRLHAKNPKIFEYDPTTLVDLSHKWKSWAINYEVAEILDLEKGVKIPTKMIIEDAQYYY